jgi:hypothetical protein
VDYGKRLKKKTHLSPLEGRLIVVLALKLMSAIMKEIW